MNKNIIVKILTQLREGEFDVDECIFHLEEYEHTDYLISDLELLSEVKSKAKFDKRLEELILSIEMDTKNTRKITHKDLIYNNKLVRQSTIDSLNEMIRNILKKSQ